MIDAIADKKDLPEEMSAEDLVGWLRGLDESTKHTVDAAWFSKHYHPALDVIGHRLSEFEAQLAEKDLAIEHKSQLIEAHEQEVAEAQKKERSVEARLKAADELVGLLRRHLRSSSSDSMPDDVRRSLGLLVRTYRDAKKRKGDE